jgi:hypothetical protein
MIFLQVSGAAREEHRFKRSNFQVISQFIHVKDISKVNDNGNQYKQKLILWYWTNNYFLMGFTASKIYFYLETKLINNGISFNFFHVPDCHLTPLI